MKTLVIALILCGSIFSVASEEIVAPQAEVTTTTSTASAAVKPESEIPINVGQLKPTIETSSTANRLMLTGIVVSLMLATAYYFVRKYKSSNNINKSNMQIKVLSQHFLGPKKSLAIIRVAGESVLIGVTDTNISMIKSLSLLDEELPSVEIPQTFVESMENKNPEKQVAQPMDELEEEFSFASVKDTVSKKLKSMRSLS